MRARASLLLGSSILTSSANAGSITNSISKATLHHEAPPTAPTSTADSLPVCTNVWSTTETTITRPQWYGPTLVTILASRTITTLEQKGTSYPCTLTDTIISCATYEYRMTFSDGHSSTSISSAQYTIPTTRVQLLAPTATLSCGIEPS